MDGIKTENTCRASTTDKCFLGLPDIGKNYLKINNLTLDLTATGGYNNSVTVNAITESLGTTTKLKDVKIRMTYRMF